MMYFVVRSLLIVSFVLTWMAAAIQAATLPDLPTTFINSPPLSKEGLRGKVVVLYFYEETCPGCRELWADKIKIANSFKDKPVIFIAINSGNSVGEVSSYMQEVKCSWPTIVDTDRSFEKACGITEPIAIGNTLVVKVVSPTGEMRTATHLNYHLAVTDNLKTAKWKIDPKEIPDSLKVAWQFLEIGNYNQALTLMAASEKKQVDEQSKAALAILKSTILEEFNKVATPAKEAEAAGNAWTALKGYQTAVLQFSNLPETKELKTKITKLNADPAVTREMKAAKLWNDAQIAARSPNAATQKRALQQAQQVVKEFPNTEAGSAAQAALDSIPK
jgi:thiol-disulfide isomerase/thioredoxin